MTTVVAGYGSIGKRHAEVFKKNGSKVVLVTTQKNISEYKTYSDLKSCLKNEDPQIVVISNRTSDHYPTLMNLQELGYSGSILVEKPLFEKTMPVTGSNEKTFVAYNLRFHPALLKLKKDLQNQKVLSVMAYVGQNLKMWRPGRNYRELYSGQKNLGGGVLRDLSHELDFVTWLFGEPQEIIARGGKISNLEIETDDSWSILLKTKNAEQVTITLNYLDHVPSRFLIVNTNENTYKVDLISSDIDKNHTYSEQSKALLNKNYSDMCTFKEGLKIIKLIEMIEESNSNKKWVTL